MKNSQSNPLERLHALLTANINELLDRAEHPLLMLNQLLRDLHDQHRQLRTMLINAMAEERLSQQQIDEHIAEAGKWQHKAVFSVGQQRDDLARRALANRLREEDTIKSLRSRQAIQQTEIARIQELATRLDDRIAELEKRRNTLVVSQPKAGEQRPAQSSRTLDMAIKIGDNLEAAERYMNKLGEQADRDSHAADIHIEQMQPQAPESGDEIDALIEDGKLDQELQLLKARVQQQLSQDT